MSTPTSKAIEIFQPGRHVAMSGAALDFSESDLQASADAYNPAKHEAPIVVGHPKADAPAYGWVRKLAFAEGSLEAEPHQVNPDFAELVASGAFKKVSASFYSPDSPQNPVPGVYYLRHVGFLGAQPPAVKGLRSPEFADAEEGVVEFGDWSDMQNASLWRRMREWIIARFGLDEADKTIPDYAVATLEDDARQDDADETAMSAPCYSEQPNQETKVTPEQKAALEAENAQLKQQLAEAQARDKAAQAAARHTYNAAFAETLIKAGKLLPAQKDFVVAFMDHVAADIPPTADEVKAAIWVRIKAERDRRKAGGFKVNVGSSNKWFHSDTDSRIQHLGLKDKARDLIAGGGVMTDKLTLLGQTVKWKTMDGTFVDVSAQIAFDTVASAGALDAQLFTAAETHKAAMEASVDPAAYDFSAGWPKVFGEA